MGEPVRFAQGKPPLGRLCNPHHSRLALTSEVCGRGADGGRRRRLPGWRLGEFVEAAVGLVDGDLVDAAIFLFAAGDGDGLSKLPARRLRGGRVYRASTPYSHAGLPGKHRGRLLEGKD